MKENTIFYQVLKPSPIKSPDGSAQEHMAAMAPSMGEAVKAALHLGLVEFSICLTVCVLEKVPDLIQKPFDASPIIGQKTN